MATKIALPKPVLNMGVPLERCLYERRSIRKYNLKNLEVSEVSQLLWAANGKNFKKRTAPSAGGLYPIVIYAVWMLGFYRYHPEDHALEEIKQLPKRARWNLYEYSLKQSAINMAPLLIVITADYEKTTRKYGNRGSRYVLIEVGHIAQNIALQAVSLNLGSVPIGAFSDLRIQKILGIEEYPLYVIPVGKID